MRIAIYFNHYQTLGHATRVFVLAQALKKRYGKKVRLLIVHSGKQSVLDLDKYAEVVDVPFSLGGKWFHLQRGFRLTIQSAKRLGMDALLKERVSVIKKALGRFRPDIFITEYYPFRFEFWAFELEFIITYLKREFGTKIVSSVGYPDFEPRTEGMLPYYDAVFFHHQPSEMRHYLEYLSAHGFEDKAVTVRKALSTYRKKIQYTGYLLEERALKSADLMRQQLGAAPSQRLVVISRGGGVVRDDMIISGICAARCFPDVFFFISCGPATPKETYTRFKRLSAGQRNVRLVYYESGFEDVMNAADVNVAMAGYNTVSRLLWLKKQSIIIPLESFSADIEQERRIDFIKRFGFFRILRDNPVPVEGLASALKELLDDPLKARGMRALRFDGAKNTVQALACLV